MTQPFARPAQPQGRPPAPAPTPASVSASPPGRQRAPGLVPPPVRRTAWAEGVHRLRAAAMTEPGRLRAIGGVLAALVVLFGVLTVLQVSARTSAADAVVRQSEPLGYAARVYRSLADADTAASSGFLAGGDEPQAVRGRYEKDIAQASRLLAASAVDTGGSARARKDIRELNEQLPVYTGYVESARANNRQGVPLGGAYLRYAHERMRDELLPAAGDLYEAQTARLGREYGDAKAWPWCALAAGVLAVGALAWAQRRDFRRTNRVFNPGLLGATAACAVALLWVTTAHAVSRCDLSESDASGARSMRLLNEAWIGSLRARGDENMTLVARGAGSAYEKSYEAQMSKVAGSAAAGSAHGAESGGRGSGERADGGLLAGALSHADDRAGAAPVRDAQSAVGRWRGRHAEARAKDVGGDYDDAVKRVIGAKGSTDESFDEVDADLRAATDHEQAEFVRSAGAGRAATGELALGAGLLALLGAALAVRGLGRRLSEYR